MAAKKGGCGRYKEAICKQLLELYISDVGSTGKEEEVVVDLKPDIMEEWEEVVVAGWGDRVLWEG